MKSLLLLIFTLSSYFVFSQKLFTIPTSVCKNGFIKISTVTAKKNETKKSEGVFYRTDLNFILVNGKKYFEDFDLPYEETPNSPNKSVYGEIIYKGLSKSKYFYFVITKGGGRYYENPNTTVWEAPLKLQYRITAYYCVSSYMSQLNYSIPVDEAGDFIGVNGDVIRFMNINMGGYETTLYPELNEDPNSTYCKLFWCVNCIGNLDGD
jgi:hypothetical protein